MEYTHNYADARLVSEFINRSAETVDWLIDYGVELCDLIAYYPGAKYVWHFRKDNSPFITDLLYPVSTKVGAQYHFKTKVNKLIMEDNSAQAFLQKMRTVSLKFRLKQ
jgi:hypothetical protein